MELMIKTIAMMRGRSTVDPEAHNLLVAGSIPAPALENENEKENQKS